MAARHQQRQVRERRRHGLQQRRQQVAFEVVHGHRRNVPGIGQRAPQRGAGQQRPDEPGTGGIGDAVELLRAWFCACSSVARTSGNSRRT